MMIRGVIIITKLLMLSIRVWNMSKNLRCLLRISICCITKGSNQKQKTPMHITKSIMPSKWTWNHILQENPQKNVAPQSPMVSLGKNGRLLTILRHYYEKTNAMKYLKTITMTKRKFSKILLSKLM